MKKSLFNFAATMLMSAGAVVFNACSDDNTDSDGGVGTLKVTPASLEPITEYGGSCSFDVRSNSYWHVSVEDADELPLDWASADIVSGMGNASVNLSVETNDGQTVRTGRIVFELDDMSSRTEIPFSQQGNDAGGTETVYAITPISDFFLCDPQSADGGEYRVYTCTFDADTETVTFSQTGNTVWRIGGTDDKTSRVFGKSQIYNGRFATTGWGGEDWEKSALIVKMKATSDLKGRLRFGFGFVSADAVPKNWECTWSADGKSWNKGMEVAATPYTDFSPTFELKSTSPYKMARFSISEGQTIKKGNFLYIYKNRADGQYAYQRIGSTVDRYRHAESRVLSDDARKEGLQYPSHARRRQYRSGARFRRSVQWP